MLKELRALLNASKSDMELTLSVEDIRVLDQEIREDAVNLEFDVDQTGKKRVVIKTLGKGNEWRALHV